MVSKASEKVKRWRKASKVKIVKAMGGKCVICGYCKCNAALVLHHLNPDEKEIGLGAIRANPKNWVYIVKELRKCVLLCANCHGEVHDGLSFVPEDAVKFDERYSAVAQW